MIIKTLIENTTTDDTLVSEHGLSLYIETSTHKILFDMGQTDAFALNAEKLGIDLSAVDIAVLSHGHYDHGGGLKAFLELNTKSPVYISRHAFEPHYNGSKKYIGLDTSLSENKRLIFTDDILKIDDELELFSCNDKARPYDMGSFGLNMMQVDKFIPDDFRHEQYLLINENDKKVLISGCSHKGILNIVSWFSPDVLIGGFHFVKLDPDGEGKEVLSLAAGMLSQHPTEYYICHCTCIEQYEFLKKTMNSKLHYLSTGQTIII